MDILAQVVCSTSSSSSPPKELLLLQEEGHVVLREYQGSYLVKSSPKRRNVPHRKPLPWEEVFSRRDYVFEIEVEKRINLLEEITYETFYKIGFYALLDICFYFGLVRDDIDHGGGQTRKVEHQGERKVNTVIVTGKLSRGLPWGEGGTKIALVPSEVVSNITQNRDTGYMPLYRVFVTRTKIGSVRPKKRKNPSPSQEEDAGEEVHQEEEEEADI